MVNNRKVVPEAQNALNNMKYEIASQVGVTLNKGYNGNIASRDAGKIGGNMVKRMIEIAERQISNK